MGYIMLTTISRYVFVSLAGLMPLAGLACAHFGPQQLKKLQQQVAQVTVPHKSTLRITSHGQTREYSLNGQVIGFDGKSTTGTAAGRRVCSDILDSIRQVIGEARDTYGNAISTVTVAIATPPGSPACAVTIP